MRGRATTEAFFARMGLVSSYALMKWRLGDWRMEGISLFVKTEEMMVHKSKDTGENDNFKKKKKTFLISIFNLAHTLVLTDRNLLSCVT